MKSVEKLQEMLINTSHKEFSPRLAAFSLKRGKCLRYFYFREWYDVFTRNTQPIGFPYGDHVMPIKPSCFDCKLYFNQRVDRVSSHAMKFIYLIRTIAFFSTINQGFFYAVTCFDQI